MKLRATIRPPKRLNDEEYETPYSATSLRRARKPTVKPHVIQFNPNNPPAAFPTLDKPRVPGSNDDKVNNPQDDDKDAKVDLEDISFDEIENLKASNGPWNPIYMRNMELMANAGNRESQLDLDVEDTDEDTSVDRVDSGFSTPTCLIPDPQWDDLSASIRMEIFGNLLQMHSWSSACVKLGISARDQIRLRKAWNERDEQTNEENAKLEEMREKQLNMLLRVDNSLLKRDSTSYWRDLREVQHSTLSRLRRSPLTSHFMCNTDQIAVARIFLEKRGLDPKLIGTWSNSIPVTKGLEAERDGSNDNDDPWLRNIKRGLEPTGTEKRDSHSRGTPAGANSTTSRVSFINSIGTATSVSPVDVARHRMGAANPVTRWIKSQRQRFSQPSQSNILASLNVAKGKATQIQSTAQCGCIDPTHLIWDLEHPPLDFVYLGLTPTVGDTTHSLRKPSGLVPASTMASISTSISQPVRRTLGGNWSYKSAESKQPPASTSARYTRNKLDKVKSSARKGSLNTNNNSREQQRPAPQLRPNPTKTEESPSLVDLDKHTASIDQGESPPENTETSRAASPALNGDSREGSDSISITPPTSDNRPTAHASESEAANDEDFEEEEEEETETDEMDEVVLVPFGPPT